MSISAELLQIAKEIAQNARSQLAALDQEEAQIEARKSELQAERTKIGLAAQRALSFRPQVASVFQCPRCWVDHERRARLRLASGSTRTKDRFQCHTCGFEYTVATR